MTDAENLLEHVETLCANYWRFTGRELIDAGTDAADLIQRMVKTIQDMHGGIPSGYAELHS